MAKNIWRFLHISNHQVYYYRRVIPKPLRFAFNNQWEIKKSLKTKNKQLAIVRHNDLNMQVEKKLSQVRGKLSMSDGKRQLILDAKKEAVAIPNQSFELQGVMSGVIMELRGQPLQLPSGKMITPAPLTIKKN